MEIRIAALALCALLVCAAPAAAQQETIDVVGDASLSAKNDTARIAVGTKGRRPTPRAALGVAAARMRRIVARVKALGVESGDIKTRFVNVSRLRVGPKGDKRIVYVASNSVAITIREVGSAGRVIDAASRGASGIGGPTFFIADTRGLYRQALVTAFDVARQKAEDLAARAGRTLGPAVSIREFGFEVSPEEDSGFEQGAGQAPQARPRTPVSPGTSRVSAGVFVRFAPE